MMKNILCLMLLAITASPAFAAEIVGQVGYMSGTLVAQRTDETILVLAPNSPLMEGDVLITSKDGYAQLKMKDGTQMTLRPESNLKIEAYRFRQEAPKEDNAVFRLIKGGLRTVSGLISKRGNADAYQLRAKATTIGIRGTDFTARLCADKECQNDAANKAATSQVPANLLIGRVMSLQGDMVARDRSGNERKLLPGSPVYERDTLDTDIKSHAVVVFRDESRITLQESSSFYVEKFKYDKAAAQESAALRLLKGGVRVVTGWIGRVQHNNYMFAVGGATIGIRGTGFDAWCNGGCVDGSNPGATLEQPLDGAGVYVWSGAVSLITPKGVADVDAQHAAILARDGSKPALLPVVPRNIIENSVPRPDSVPVDMDKEFNSEPVTDGAGLYVAVHLGQVIMNQNGRSLNLGAGESGYANGKDLKRLSDMPEFMGSGSMDTGNSKNPSVNPQGCVIVF